MRNQTANLIPEKNTIRRLLAAEGYLELRLPERALRELDRIVDAGELFPYVSFLRGQAYHTLGQYGDAIDDLQLAATLIPAPLNQRAWDDLSDCFRQEGLDELADIAEMFAEDPLGGADQEFPEVEPPEHFLDFHRNSPEQEDLDDPWNRSPLFQADDFEDLNFDEDGEEFGCEFEDDAPKAHRKPPRK